MQQLGLCRYEISRHLSVCLFVVIFSRSKWMHTTSFLTYALYMFVCALLKIDSICCRYGCYYLLSMHVDALDVFQNVCMLCVSMGKNENCQRLSVCVDVVTFSLYISIYAVNVSHSPWMHSTSFLAYACYTFLSTSVCTDIIYLYMWMLFTPLKICTSIQQRSSCLNAANFLSG